MPETACGRSEEPVGTAASTLTAATQLPSRTATVAQTRLPKRMAEPAPPLPTDDPSGPARTVLAYQRTRVVARYSLPLAKVMQMRRQVVTSCDGQAILDS